MKLQAGKRYVMRNGEVTGVIGRNENEAYPFYDNEECWTHDGFVWEHRNPNDRDLISEWQPDQPEHPADEQGEEEWLTTETDRGFRAVIQAVINGRQTIENRHKDGGTFVSCSHNITKWDMDNYIYRIKNPAYQPEPEQPEPEVGQVWKCKNDGKRFIVKKYDEDAVMICQKIGGYGERMPTRTGFKCDYTYIDTINLSALTGEE